MRILYAAAFVLLFMNVIAFSQEITLLDSTTSAPVGNAAIYSENRHVYSDSAGNASLTGFNPGDTITVSHAAYNAVKLVYPNIPDTLMLVPRVYVTGNVSVAAGIYEPFEIDELVYIDAEIKGTAFTAGDILKKHTSFFVKDYGGEAGVKTVSSRGLGSENTIVLFNEARVNDLRTGNFDFSQVSSLSLSSVHYEKNAASSGYISSGGVVKLSSYSVTKSLAYRITSDLSQTFMASYGGNSKLLSWGVQGERAFSANEYDYKFDEKEYERKNAHFNRTFIAGNINYITDKNVTSVYGHYSYFNSGIPGYVVSNNRSSSNAFNTTRSFLVIANNYLRLGNGFDIRSTASWHRQQYGFHDPDKRLLTDATQQNSLMRDIGIKNVLEADFNPFHLTVGHEFGYADLDSLGSITTGQDIPGNISRSTHRVFGTASYHTGFFRDLLGDVSLNSAAAYEYLNESIINRSESDEVSWSSGIKLFPRFTPSVMIDFNYSSDLRKPTFNERYYSAFYNSGLLKREKFTGFNTGIITNIPLAGTENKIEIRYFDITGKNKIIWVPYMSVMQVPRNVGKIRSRGVEINYNGRYDDLSYDILYSFTDTRNRTYLGPGDNSFDKLLIYTPRHRLNVNIDWNFGKSVFSLSGLYTGKRYYTADNTPFSKLDPYFITNFSFTRKFDISWSGDLTVTFNISNLFNTEYLVIQSYPMPLRTYSLFIHKRI